MGARLRNLKIDRVDLVDKGANQKAHIVLVKRDTATRKDAPTASQVHVDKPIGEEQQDPYEKSTLDAGQRNALPDSAFAAVWTDKDGKKQRKFPYKHADGSVDLPHLRNALSRLEQHPDIPDNVKSEAKAKLQAAAKTHGVGEQNKRRPMKNESMFKRLLSFIAKEAEAEAAVDGADDDENDEAGQQAMKEGKLPDGYQKYLKGLHAHLGKMIEATKGADGSHDHLPADHPIHKVKEAHEAVGKLLGAYGSEPGGNEGSIPSHDEGGPEPFGREPSSRNAATKRAVEKALEPVRVELAKANKRAEEAEKIAKAERDARTNDRITTELKKFRGVAVDPTKDVAMFKKLEETDPEVAKRVRELLAGADEALSKSALFGEMGSGRADDTNGGSAWARIEAEAAKLIEKNTGLTKAKAIDRVMKQRPDLVREYNAEQSGARQ